ncbi:MAG: hypothetical protein L0Y55_00580 [Anaerolineales bacterium]|nr:hypothetical protein [Anaerolineales bacterium]
MHSLSQFPTDQIFLAQLLPSRQGAILHSSGVILDGRGFLFVGHSSAGKSTMVKMLREHAEILCDDRIIVRQDGERFRIYGTWSHGEISQVSANHAPLAAMFFLEKAGENRIERLEPNYVTKQLWRYTIKALMTKGWAEQTWTILETIGKTVPCYRLFFDKSGQVVNLLKNWKE